MYPSPPTNSQNTNLFISSKGLHDLADQLVVGGGGTPNIQNVNQNLYKINQHDIHQNLSSHLPNSYKDGS